MDRQGQHVGKQERGYALIVGLIIVLVMTTFSAALVVNSTAHHMHAKTQAERARANALAEGAATLLLNDLDVDPRAPVVDTANYMLVGRAFMREYLPFEAADGSVRVEVTYLESDSGSWKPVAFDSRVAPTELYDRVRVRITAFRPGVERTIEIEMEQQFLMFDSAIVSDAVAWGPGADGDKSRKAEAQNGHIVFDDRGRPSQFYVNGSLMANGGVYHEGSLLETATVNDHFMFAGSVETELANTPREIPDYTAIGSSDQLFDFDRFIAAARAGAGQEFTSLSDFVDAQKAANDAGTPLEGIIVLSIDDSQKTIEQGHLLDGINIRGTLVFNFEAGVDPMFKVFIKCACNINAADVSSLVPTDPSTYRTGYGGPWANDALRPHNVDISGDGFRNFHEDDDMPALMFNTGIIDIHDSANVCGLVYGPSFIEIENKGARLQYFNGAILGGAGVYIEGNGTSGTTVINFDRNTINKLATQNAKGMGLQVIGWRVHD